MEEDTLDMVNPDKEILKEIDKFIENRKKEFDNDVRDFRISKNIASGNGFTSIKSRSSKQKIRQRVCINLLEPIINSIVYRYTNDPFQFMTDAPIDKDELTSQLGTALREAAIDGKSYILSYVDGPENDLKLKFKKLNNFNVIYGACDYVDGEDVKQVVYVDKKQVKGSSRTHKTNLAINLQPVLEFSNDEIPVLTYWKLENGILHTYTIENDTITEHSEVEARYLPVTRIYAKEVTMDLDTNYRGLYYLVQDLLKTIDYTASKVQERIATAPTAYFTISRQALGKNKDQWENVNDKPRPFITYDSTDGNGNEYPVPVRNDLSVQIDDLMSSLNVHQGLVSGILGVEAGDPNTVAETAEAVLLRRENKDTAVNHLLKNLLDSAKQIGAIVTDITGYPCEVVASVFEKMKKNEELEKLIALANMSAQNEKLYAILPAVIDRLDVDDDTKQKVTAGLMQSKQPSQQELQLQQQLEQANAQIQALKENLMTSQAAIESGVHREAIQQQTKAMELQYKQQIEIKKLQLEEIKLQLQHGIDIEKNNLKLAELEASIQKDQDEIDLKIANFVSNYGQKRLDPDPQHIIHTRI